MTPDCGSSLVELVYLKPNRDIKEWVHVSQVVAAGLDVGDPVVALAWTAIAFSRWGCCGPLLGTVATEPGGFGGGPPVEHAVGPLELLLVLLQRQLSAMGMLLQGLGQKCINF